MNDRRPPEPMRPRQWAIAGAFIGILFAIGSIARGDVAPGIVGGILAAILCYLVLREISARQRQRIADWDRRHERTG
jgi:drug/metabolite transporter (DMT)-like permease